MNATALKTATGSGLRRAPLGNALMLIALAALCGWLLTLNTGAWWPAPPSTARIWMAIASVAAYAGFCAALWWRTRPRPCAVTTPADDAVLIGYASQTGFAHELAQRTADSLQRAGVAVHVLPLEHIDAARLARTPRALFIVSTTGEGDPPDHALGFVRQVMGRPATLESLQYAVLALGDREYEDFCGFGHQLDGWLRRQGAQPWFDLIEVDNADEGALRHWQHHLGHIGGIADLPDWTPPRYQTWTLAARERLNPGSAGEPAWRIDLLPPVEPESIEWQAGDIAEIGPRHPAATVDAWLAASGLDGDAPLETDDGATTLREAAARSHLPDPAEVRGQQARQVAAALAPLPHREYSIASLPPEGSLRLLVRRMRAADGTPGLGSGWLCDHAPLGGQIALRIRTNANFHPPAPERPLILIGNGTGMASLRAHLRARIDAGLHRNWLLFGERNEACDFFHGDEIRQWQRSGAIARVDLAFSRDQPTRLYVQDVLRRQAGELRRWVDEGAALYVCGSLAGMAPGVDAVLRDALGNEAVERMLADGRYRRDVY
ncbi:sulfite reductase subunit alpha [Pseudoxanthomonas mexicana]|uniref:sulfite reductase subunit alpha n=1 Tax=Pseudoxanthomonas mexicana TaxID=128785 RepID=UPI00398B4C98